MSSSPSPFAKHGDYEDRGYDAAKFESEAVLDTRLEQASRYVRSLCTDIDDRIDSGDLDEDLVTDVVCSMVHRTVPADDMAGIASVQQSAGPFSQSTSLVNPSGDLYLTKGERLSLGCGRQVAFTVGFDNVNQPPYFPWDD